MIKNMCFGAILSACVPFSAIAVASHHHKLVDVVLEAENASFVTKSVGDKVEVVTYGYKTPDITCKFLQDKGVNVISVTNYAEKDKMLIISSKDC